MVVGLIVGGGFLYLFLRDQDWGLIQAHLAKAELAPLVVAAALGVAMYAVKVRRWADLLPAPTPSWSARAHAIALGFGANVVLPGRVGEALRVAVIHRRADLPVALGISGVVLERLMDLAALGFLLAMGTLGLGVESESVVWMRSLGALIAMGTLAAPVVLYLLLGRDPEATEARLAGLASRLGPNWGPRIAGFLGSLARGVSVLETPGKLAWVFLVSVIHWGLNVGLVLAVAVALEVPLSAAAAAVVLGAVAFASALPQAPGFIGPFHWAVATVLELLGSSGERAAAFAILFWLVGVSVPVLLGAVSLALGGLTSDSRGGPGGEPEPATGNNEPSGS
jgi:uncharacterized protein (TIRG00374 family)